ncbi:MAG: hypothetical protein ACKN9D_00355 [Actinomycetales bacterium]
MPRQGLHRGSGRLIRGMVLGSACAVLSAAAHSTGGGALLDGGLLLSLVIAMSLGIAWADRRATPVRLTLFVLGCQTLLHVVATLSNPHHLAANDQGSALIPGPAMVLAHALAGILMAAVLVHGDSLAHRWADFLRGLASATPTLPAIPVPGSAAPAALATCSWTNRPPASRFMRRGPPEVA